MKRESTKPQLRAGWNDCEISDSAWERFIQKRSGKEAERMPMQFRIRREQIAKAMLRAGINARQLANVTGISEVSIYKAINGKTAPRNSTLKKICDALNVDPAEVCELVSEYPNIDQ